MKKWLYAGTALLVLQLVLAVFFNMNGRDLAAFTPYANLLDFAPHEVDGIVVFGEGNKKLTLTKEHGTWLLPEEFKAPADEKKVNDLLEKLSTLKQGLAVATTKGAAKRFKVSADDFERHVVLKKGADVVADFFVGTSPGFKMVHARVHDRPEVVSVELNTYELEAEPDRWIDRNMAGVEKDKINDLTIGDIALARQDTGWSLTGLSDNEELNTTEVDNLLGKISGLTVNGVLDPGQNSELFKQKPALTVAMTLTDKSKRKYVFEKPAKEKYYVMKSSDQDFYFKVDTWVVDGITKFARQKLIQPKKVAAAAQGQDSSQVRKQ